MTAGACACVVGLGLRRADPLAPSHSFLSSHPAGAQAILRHAGKDSSEDFGFHSERAKGLWEKLLVGRVEGAASDGDSACVVM